jgi:hypothetical protein
MKNIHLIPTDKPSRLIKNNNNQLKLTIQTLPKDVEIGCYPQHIYITSDEEIKDGWSYDRMMRTVNKIDNVYSSKIILTTDQDLIADGVQAIDDEFLEWFVKNPSCENVETVKGKMKLNDDGQEYGFPDMSKYKIVIPQEEPKQIKCYCGHTITCDCLPIKKSFDDYLKQNPYKETRSFTKEDWEADIWEKWNTLYNSKEEPKQETLEQVAKEFVLSHDFSKLTNPNHLANRCFQLGAKWQQERMYSEEEVLNLLRKCHFVEQNIEEWFEQFKKK